MPDEAQLVSDPLNISLNPLERLLENTLSLKVSINFVTLRCNITADDYPAEYSNLTSACPMKW